MMRGLNCVNNCSFIAYLYTSLPRRNRFFSEEDARRFPVEFSSRASLKANKQPDDRFNCL